MILDAPFFLLRIRRRNRVQRKPRRRERLKTVCHLNVLSTRLLILHDFSEGEVKQTGRKNVEMAHGFQPLSPCRQDFVAE